MSTWLERSQNFQQRKQLLFDSVCSRKKDFAYGKLIE